MYSSSKDVFWSHLSLRFAVSLMRPHGESQLAVEKLEEESEKMPHALSSKITIKE